MKISASTFDLGIIYKRLKVHKSNNLHKHAHRHYSDLFLSLYSFKFYFFLLFKLLLIKIMALFRERTKPSCLVNSLFIIIRTGLLFIRQILILTLYSLRISLNWLIWYRTYSHQNCRIINVSSSLFFFLNRTQIQIHWFLR